MPKIAIIGAGISGLSAAAYLSAEGYEVHVFEKNATAGGRARQLITPNGYTFDMGPSWYWMPDVFEDFFSDFNYDIKDFYELILLDPAFEMVFAGQDKIKIPADYHSLCSLFESIEKGSAARLEKFMEEARYKYEESMHRMAFMPGLSLMEFADIQLIKKAIRLDIFSSFSKHVRKYFSHPVLISLMEFPVLFLGAMPEDTPALYSLMNYAGLKLGTWYPIGGFGKVVESMRQVALMNGAHFHFNTPVEHIIAFNQKARAIRTSKDIFFCDAIIGTGDYHHIEMDLLSPKDRNYTETYWEKKTFAPSCLIFYIGLKKKLNRLQHHTLFFEENMKQHSIEIYKRPEWPSKPLFYCCCSSRTDSTVSPPGHENIFLLMPVAPGLEDNEGTREKYFNLLINRLEQHAGEPIQAYIDYKQSYCINDFIADYNAYKGNAYGLANRLSQTAILKPKMRNKKIKNLFYAGQLTVPGPGVPPSIISGKIAANVLMKTLKAQGHEVVV